MFEETKFHPRAENALFEAARVKERSDVISFEEIEQATGVNRDDPRYSQLIKRFRRRMRKERGIAMRPVIDVGFRLLTSSEQVNQNDRWRKVSRQTYRAAQEIEAVDDTELSVTDRRVRIMQLERLAEARSQSLRSIRALKKSDTHPVRALESGLG